MGRLYPPIDVIEEDLFSPSDDLVERWIAGDPSVSDALRQALEADPTAGRIRQVFEEYARPARPEGSARATVRPVTAGGGIPAWLAEMIERRVEAQKAFSDVVEPAPGQLRLVDRAIGSDGVALGWDINRPLGVLLWRETEDPGVWVGWMAAPDTDYATYWDVILEEQDRPFDPIVSMIQIWNPVQISLPSTGRVLGQVSDSRLAAIAAAFSDLLAGERPDESSARPGMLIDRVTSTHERLMTGTPLGGAEDPRRRYRDLYFAAAGLVKDLARLAVEAAAAQRAEEAAAAATVADPRKAAKEWVVRLVERLAAFAALWGARLEPVVPQAAMGLDAERGSESYRIPDLLEVGLIPVKTDEGGAVLKLKLRSLATVDLKVRFSTKGGRQLRRFTLEPGGTDDAFLSSGGEVILEVDGGERGRGSWDLSV